MNISLLIRLIKLALACPYDFPSRGDVDEQTSWMRSAQAGGEMKTVAFLDSFTRGLLYPPNTGGLDLC